MKGGCSVDEGRMNGAGGRKDGGWTDWRERIEYVEN